MHLPPRSGGTHIKAEGEKPLQGRPLAFRACVCACTHKEHTHTPVHRLKTESLKIYDYCLPLLYISKRSQKGNEGGLACEQERVGGLGARAQALGWGNKGGEEGRTQTEAG